ncbi:hypothetical protein [Kitasatospora sp. NPDC059160]|uniref:hypothetical protein n=1 Tax=Kitasatospora sp. NPDC059160 TaxID=3346748 RepID=UPI0036CB2115
MNARTAPAGTAHDAETARVLALWRQVHPRRGLPNLDPDTPAARASRAAVARHTVAPTDPNGSTQ